MPIGSARNISYTATKTAIFGAYIEGGEVYEEAFNGNNYRIHVFTRSNTLKVIKSGTVEYLIVGAGGAGGFAASCGGGGGGAGGLLNATTPVSTGEYDVLVGESQFSTFAVPDQADSSSVFGITAQGGGKGGSIAPGGQLAPSDGGSGGGGGAQVEGRTSLGASGIAGQGNDGGDGLFSNTTAQEQSGGGGGGAAASGQDGQLNTGGNGGNGVYIDWADAIGLGDNGYFAGGGGGATRGAPAGGDGGSGGLGGGGKGGYDNSNGVAGQPNTGGGSGGCSLLPDYPADLASNSGSGIVIIRYQI